MFPYLNQVYAGLTPQDATVNQWIANTQRPVAAQPMGPPAGTIVMPGQPVNVNAPVLAGVPAQFQAQPAPLPVHAPPPGMAPPPQPHPQGQMVDMGLPPAAEGPPQQSQDISVGVAAPPIQYRTVSGAGRAAGELNTMGPNQERFLTKAAGVEGNAQTAAAANVASAMTAQQVPLDTRAQYLTELAQREAQDQTGRNEQLRQRQEDFETEAKALREMKVDPNRRLKSGEAIGDALAIIFGGIGQGFMRRAGDTNAQNTGLQLAMANKNRDVELQQGEIAQRKEYLAQVQANMRAQREMQGDQVASTQRQAALMNQATGAQFDQAGIGVAMSEALAKGDIAQAQALGGLYRQQAAAQRYVPASGGGRSYQVKLGNGAVLNMSEKEFNAYAKDNEKGTIETGQKIAINSAEAKAKAEGKGKDDEARMVDIGGGKFVKARSTEEAIKLDGERRAIEEQQGSISAVKDAKGKVSLFDKYLHGVSAGLIKPKAISDLETKANQLAFSEAKKGGGIVTEGDMRRAQGTVGDHLSLNPFSNQTAKLDAIQAELDRRKELLDRGRDITTRAPAPVKKGW